MAIFASDDYYTRTKQTLVSLLKKRRSLRIKYYDNNEVRREKNKQVANLNTKIAKAQLEERWAKWAQEASPEKIVIMECICHAIACWK